MTEHPDLAAALRAAAEPPHPAEVERVLRGGIARGRVVRRRRTLQTTLAAVAVVGVIGAAAGVAADVRGDDRPTAPSSGAGFAEDPAGSEPPSPRPSDAPTPAFTPRAPIPAAEVPAAFAGLFPGEVTELPQKEVNDGAPIVDFLWNGYQVRIGIVPSEPSYGDTPAEQCRTSGPGNGDCRELPAGDWVQTAEFPAPPGSAAASYNTATLYTTDGWTVLALALNAAEKEGVPPLSEDPPFTTAQLEDVVTDVVWFDGVSAPPTVPDRSSDPVEEQRIAVRAKDIPAIVTRIAPGEVVEYEPAGGYIDAGDDVVAHFQLNGMLVSAGISRVRESDPLQRCRRSGGTSCRELPDGSVVVVGEAEQGPAVDGGVSSVGTSRFLPSFDIFALSYNAAAGKDSPVLAGEPPIAPEQLEAIVRAEGWVTTG